MKRSLLESIRGLPRAAAIKLAQEAGVKVEEVGSAVQAVPALAKHNTVILFVNEDTNIVDDVMAGDPLQVEND